MRKRPDVRELAHATVPIVVAIAVLATAPLWEPRSALSEPGSLVPLFVLILVAALAGLHLPTGDRTLGLGALALAPAIWFFGLAWAGWLAATAYVLREIGRRLFFDIPLRQMADIRILPTVADAARVSLATVLAGYVWLAGTGDDPVVALAGPFLFWGLAAFVTYVASLILLHWIELRDFGVVGERFPGEVARSSSGDLLGWIAGGLLVRVILAAGWVEILMLAL